MLSHKLVVRNVIVQRSDDIVPIVLSVFQFVIKFVAERLGITNQVEPVPSPAFSKMWRLEQPVNDLLKRSRCFILVVEKLLDFFGGRRQTNDVEVRSADKRSAVGIRRRLKTVLVQLRNDEPVDRRTRPACV